MNVLKVRKNDAWGDGAYGASRDGGARRHNGVDFVAMPGDAVRALVDGKFMHAHAPYINDSDYTGLNIRDINGNTNLYFYVMPCIAPGCIVHRGDVIGYAQNISAKYSPLMTNHFHFEVRIHGDKNNTVNPLKYLQ